MVSRPPRATVLLRPLQLVVDCTGNDAVSTLASSECLDRGTPYLRAQTYHSGVVGEIVLLRPGDACLTCLEQALYSPALKREETVEMSHGLAEENESHFNRYQKATSRKVNLQTGSWGSKVDYNTIEALYNELSHEAKGYLVGGKQCTHDNKPEWIKLIPLWHKTQVIDEIFGEDRVKKT